ncbi:MAG: hypothetical protein KDN05_11010 [Verrucomicrobiae bacterium]|nr:hypothetical protein [Verrucomicrobiae bacterium]
MIRSIHSFLRKHGARVGVVALLAIVIVCAWPGLHAPLFEDDIPQFERVAAIPHWTGVFQTDAFQFFRPVKNALFKACLPLRDHLAAIHWIGLAAYLAAALGVLRIASICLKPGWAALLAAAVWALGPTCVSTAIWLSCANISIGIVFAAVVFHFHERAVARDSVVSSVVALVFYGVALLSYEALVVVPALLWIRDLQRGREMWKWKAVLRFAAFGVAAGIFLAMRWHVAAKSVGVNDLHTAFAPGTEGWQLSVSAPWFLWRHFRMWIVPFGSLEILGSYAWLRSASMAELVFGWVFLAGLVGTAVATWHRAPPVSYGLWFFLVASIPAGNFVPGFNGPINDAYLTIPSIGLALAFAGICGFLAEKAAKRRKPIAVAAASLLIALLIYRLPVSGAYFRYWAGVWEDPVRLVLLMSESRPFQYQLKARAANMLFREGWIDQARILADEAVREAPWFPHAQLAQARVAGARRDHRRAEEFYRSALANPLTTENLRTSSLLELAGQLSVSSDKRDEAADLCRILLNSPSTPPAIRILAVIRLSEIYRSQGMTTKARATLERGLRNFPDEPSLSDQLKSLEKTD